MEHESLSLQPINVRLCGSIPRKDIRIVDDDEDNAASSLRGAPCSLQQCLTSDLCPSYFAKTNGPTLRVCDGLEGIVSQPGNTMRLINGGDSLESSKSPCPVVEPPVWAVPAQGETRLEPVCEAAGRQSSVDLTQKACFKVGRSPNADVQLFHATSSRRHAMIFHHDNGSCYIVDCGSAHGTFLNGQRISSPSCNGVAVPHKVRRGALIRFGGPGAPCFILKSFSFNLDEIEDSATSPDIGDLVRRNTRLNALGASASKRVWSRLADTIEAALVVSRKRSFDSLDSRDTVDEVPCDKRMRCSSPPMSPPSPLRLVSPDLPLTGIKARHRRVTFSPEAPQLFFPASVTPEDDLSSEEDNATE